MVLVSTKTGRFTIVTGTAAEVFQELSDQNITPRRIVDMASDGTSAIYHR